jgi:HEAT repeat protein
MKSFDRGLAALFLTCLYLSGPVAAQAPPAGHYEGKTVDEWVAVLKGHTPESRVAFQALQKIGKPAVPALVQLLKDPDEVNRNAAAAILTQLGAEAKPAQAALREALKDRSSAVRFSAATGLFAIDGSAEGLPAATEALQGNSVKNRRLAAIFLGLLGRQARPAVPALLAALKDDDAEVRGAAAVALWRVDQSEAGLPVLLGDLKNPDKAIHVKAASYLGLIGEPAVPTLLQALEAKESHARLHAILALGHIGPKAKAAIPTLVDYLNNREAMRKEPGHYQHAAAALARIDPDVKAVVPMLLKRLEDKDYTVRLAAVSSLGRLGPHAGEAVPALVKLAESADYLGALAANSLWQVSKHEAAVPALSRHLKDADRNAREAAAESLGNIGPDAKASIPALTEALKDEDAAVRQAAGAALKKVHAQPTGEGATGEKR